MKHINNTTSRVAADAHAHPKASDPTKWAEQPLKKKIKVELGRKVWCAHTVEIEVDEDATTQQIEDAAWAAAPVGRDYWLDTERDEDLDEEEIRALVIKELCETQLPDANEPGSFVYQTFGSYSAACRHLAQWGIASSAAAAFIRRLEHRKLIRRLDGEFSR